MLYSQVVEPGIHGRLKICNIESSNLSLATNKKIKDISNVYIKTFIICISYNYNCMGINIICRRRFLNKIVVKVLWADGVGRTSGIQKELFDSAICTPKYLQFCICVGNFIIITVKSAVM